jgi:hypothetical protein
LGNLHARGNVGLAGLLSLMSATVGAVLTTQAEMRHAIVGNTISGTEEGEWRIAGRSFCVRYFDRQEGLIARMAIATRPSLSEEIRRNYSIVARPGEASLNDTSRRVAPLETNLPEMKLLASGLVCPDKKVAVPTIKITAAHGGAFQAVNSRNPARASAKSCAVKTALLKIGS